MTALCQESAFDALKTDIKSLLSEEGIGMETNHGYCLRCLDYRAMGTCRAHTCPKTAVGAAQREAGPQRYWKSAFGVSTDGVSSPPRPLPSKAQSVTHPTRRDRAGIFLIIRICPDRVT